MDDGVVLFQPKRQVQIEAIQFIGFRNAEAIHAWCRDVFFVPDGAEHPMRRPSEFDSSNGHVLENAESFLVLSRGEMPPVRVNRGDWIIRDQDGLFSKIGDQAFHNLYETVTAEKNG